MNTLMRCIVTATAVIIAVIVVALQLLSAATAGVQTQLTPEAFVEFDKVQVTKNPNKIECYELYIYDLLHAGLPAKAEEIAKVESERFPNKPSIYMHSLGRALAAQGRFGEAKDAYTRALATAHGAKERSIREDLRHLPSGTLRLKKSGVPDATSTLNGGI